jgi:lipoic acid synthetase
MKDADLFNPNPKVKTSRLNVLPSNPEPSHSDQVVESGRFPSWLHRKLPRGGNLFKTGDALNKNRMHTVCEEAKCPNLLECWSKKTATFLTMGKSCTRNCGFCSIDFETAPPALEKDEPARTADSVKALGLKHVVLTMVARDDLEDGGALHLKAIVDEIRHVNPETSIELLTSDFNGNKEAWDIILEAAPDVFNYNLETVRELTPRVRHKATYERTLALLRYMGERKKNPAMKIKSGMMLGLGETEEQVHEALRDLKGVGCSIVTLGQYLQPAKNKLLVKAFITPDAFADYETYGKSIGIPYVYAGPFVRSSYNADLVFNNLSNQ